MSRIGIRRIVAALVSLSLELGRTGGGIGAEDSGPPVDVPPEVAARPWFGELLDDAGPPKEIFDPSDVPEFFRKKKQYQRWLYHYHRMNNPDDPLPLGELFKIRLRAWQRLEEMRLGTGGAASISNWSNIGPAPTQNWIGTTQTVSGQVVDVAVHPTLANTWLIAGSAGGVWLTGDTGASWSPKTDAQATLATGAVAFAKSNPSIIYAGTGSYVGFNGVGVLKSTDGGTSWQLLASSTFNGLHFHDIRVDPTNAARVVAATTGGVYRSADGGTSWSQRRSGEATDLEVDPSNFSRQYAGIAGGNDIEGLYRSPDAGVTWAPISGPWQSTSGDDVGRIEIAIAPSNVNVMYVGAQRGGGDDLLGLWRTANAWATTPSWTQITSAPNYCGTMCGYDHELIVKPTNSNMLFAGGVTLYRYDHSTGTWTDISRSSLSSGIHLDQHAMAWSGSRLIVANDGGVFSTLDDGGTWSKHNTGLAIGEFYHGALHPSVASVMQGGQQDNGSTRRPTSGGTVWDYAGLASDGGDNFFTNSNPDTRWALSIQYLGLVRWKDGAQCNVHESIPDSCVGGSRNGLPCSTAADCPGGTCEDKGGDIPFIAPVELCPSSDEIVLAGTDNVWKTTEMFAAACSLTTPAWTKVCSADPDGGEMGAWVTSMGFARGDASCNTFAFAADRSQLRLTTNGGVGCSNLDPLNQLPIRPATDIVLHTCFGKSPAQASNVETIYVTLGGVGSGHVYKTTNALGSKTWSDITPEDASGEPFDVPANTIAMDPLVPSHLYVGTELGLWRSTDDGASWTHVGPGVGLPYAPIFDIQMNDRTNQVVAFSHGRSAFKADLSRCAGDCNGDGTVTIGEAQLTDNIFLGTNDVCVCKISDTNFDGQVTIGELQTAFNNINGCP